MEEDPYDAWHAKPGPADPALVRDVLAAARATRPATALERVAIAAYEAGVTPVDLMRACYVASNLVTAESPMADDDPAYEALLDLMDRLTGFCPPGAHLEAITREVMAAAPRSP